MSVRANKDTFESEINEAEKLVIADFYSDSCVPCKRMSPLLAETEEENPESIKLVKLNINFDGETAQKYNVTSVPTLVFFKDGAEKARLTGAVKKAQLTETINSIEAIKRTLQRVLQWHSSLSTRTLKHHSTLQ